MKKKVLLQIDHDEVASTFDSIVAIDSGVDQLLTYPNVTPLEIESVIHGAIFTRGVGDLKYTAVFFSGTNVEKTEELFAQAKKCFFGPLRVSMMADPNGSNTTAVAAVLRALKHGPLAGKNVTVLAGTGPVGRRIGQLSAAADARVQIGSRSIERANLVCDQIERKTGNRPVPVEAGVTLSAATAAADADIVFAAGAVAIELLDVNWLEKNQSVQLAIDVNAVPPHGIPGISPTDVGKSRSGKICYGAIGVGQLKMKIHQAAIAQLFTANSLVLDLDEIFQIGRSLTN